MQQIRRLLMCKMFFVNVFSDMWESVKSLIVCFFDFLVDTTRLLFGIRSPSKTVFLPALDGDFSYNDEYVSAINDLGVSFGVSSDEAMRMMQDLSDSLSRDLYSGDSARCFSGLDVMISTEENNSVLVRCEYCGQKNNTETLCCEFCGGRL